MPACSKPFDPDHLTPRRAPKGPTFTLGSITVDAAMGSTAASHVEFAGAKQAATRAHGQISRAASHAEVEKTLAAARKQLEQALHSTSDPKQRQSLKARLANLEKVAAARKRELDRAAAEAQARREAERDWQRQLDSSLNRYITSQFTPEQISQLTPTQITQARLRIETALAWGMMRVGDVPRGSYFAGTYYPLEQVGKADLTERYPQGVKFNDAGFPDFSPYAIATVRLDRLGTRPQDKAEANRRIGVTRTPGYSWHHLEDGHTLQLIPTDLHNTVGHTGGFAAQRNIDDYNRLLTNYLQYAISRTND